MESAIAFNGIPANLRLPGVYVEFDNRLAGNASPVFKQLVIGQRLAAGTVAEGVPTKISQNESEIEEFFGRGSMLAEQLKAAKKAQSWLETWAIALDEDGAGAAAAGTMTITGTATVNGTLITYIAGKVIKTGVVSGDVQNAIATALSDAINADTTLPVTAAAVANAVTLTCRWKGETGNDIDIRLNYYDEKTPGGVAVAIVDMAGGTTNPDIATAITAMGDEWYNWYAMPYTDTANLVALETELDSRYGPMRQIGGRAFCAYSGTQAVTGTFGNGRNNPHISCMGMSDAPQPPYIWAAVNAVIAGFNLMNDPARQLRSLVLPGIMPPKLVDRFVGTQRNELLFDGISTYTVSSDGTVRIEAQITMYQENTVGIPDDSYLYVNTPETLERIRFDKIALFAKRYPRHKLAADTLEVGPGQPIMQPKLAKDELMTLYREHEELGWVQDVEGYKETLITQINKDNTDRLDVYDSPELVKNMRVLAVHTEFRT